LTTKQRKRGRRRRGERETPINKGRKHTHARFWRNAKNSNQPEAAPPLADCRRNALVFRFCGICGIFSAKGRERIEREPKDGSNLHNFNTKKNKKTSLADYQPPTFRQIWDLRKLDILKNKSSFGVKIC
jgi:hypothetical protein